MPDGKKFEHKINGLESVLETKVSVWKYARLPIDTFEIVYAGKTFEDSSDLRDYYVELDTIMKI